MLQCPCCAATDFKTYRFAEGDIHICNHCGLQWATVDKSRQGGFITSANEYYLNPQSLRNPATYPPYLDFFKKIAALGCKPNFRLLDVGCGGGGFLAHCLARGMDCWGVEANKELGRFMPENVLRRVHFGLAEEFVSSAKPYDVITFWDSFEHMELAFDVLDKLRSCLNPRGVVYLRVNNNWDIFNLLSQAALRVAPPIGKRLLCECFNYPDHCWNFSQKAMTSMLTSRGWTVIHAEIGETPAWRLTGNPAFRLAIESAYLINRILGGGKIGNYYLELAGI